MSGMKLLTYYFEQCMPGMKHVTGKSAAGLLNISGLGLQSLLTTPFQNDDVNRVPTGSEDEHNVDFSGLSR